MRDQHRAPVCSAHATLTEPSSRPANRRARGGQGPRRRSGVPHRERPHVPAPLARRTRAAPRRHQCRIEGPPAAPLRPRYSDGSHDPAGLIQVRRPAVHEHGSERRPRVSGDEVSVCTEVARFGGRLGLDSTASRRARAVSPGFVRVQRACPSDGRSGRRRYRWRGVTLRGVAIGRLPTPRAARRRPGRRCPFHSRPCSASN